MYTFLLYIENCSGFALQVKGPFQDAQFLNLEALATRLMQYWASCFQDHPLTSLINLLYKHCDCVPISLNYIYSFTLEDSSIFVPSKVCAIIHLLHSLLLKWSSKVLLQ